MQSKSNVPVSFKKKIVIFILFVFAVMICLSGAGMIVYSIQNGVTFQVLNSQIPGVIFGVVILFLGTRYFLSLLKLRDEVYKPTSRFSWSNFKKTKRAKTK